MRTRWIAAALVLSGVLVQAALAGGDWGCAAAAYPTPGCAAPLAPVCGVCDSGCGLGGSCPLGGCGLFGRKCRGSAYEGLDPHFNCGCNGSYKFPVPPLYTYHWPGMWQQNLMTDYHSPWRFPPLKPYVDEAEPIEMGSGPLRVIAHTSSEPEAPGTMSFSRRLEQATR